MVIWAVNRQGSLTFVDGKGAQKIGLAVETSEGESIFDLYAEDGPIVDITQRVLTGEFIAGTIQFKDGFFEVRYQPMADADSRLTGAIGVAIDVTEQTTAKAALRQSQENYRELVENINDVIYVIDNEGIITYVSPVIQSVLGYRVDELIGENFFNFIHHQDQERVEQDYASALEVVGNQREYRFLDKSGEIKWCRVSSRPIPEGHKKLGIQGVLVDVTRSKRLEEQLQRAQKMEALGTMAGGVAHDLNNILSGIVSYPELLLMDLPRNSPLRQPLTTIKKSGENAAAIVQDLLTLARRGVSARELLDLNQIVEQCLDSPEIQGLLNRQTTIRLSTRLQSDLLYIYGSAHHLSKSVSNLIFNAVEAMPEGGRVEITTANRHADRVVSGFDTVKAGDYVVVSIVDSGIGIPERDQTRIFEPFYTKKVMGQSGSGLGMAVVWGTVKDHDGFIDLQSVEGQGTQFELFFPATRDQPKQSRKDEALSDYAGRGELILVVDDMATQREIATRILKRLGYRTKSAASGEEAIEFFRQHSADLVIIDMIMDPGIDGYDTYRHIIDIYPEQKAIIASGFSETERVRKTIALGAGRYIRKPYSMGALAKALKAELER